MGDCPVAHHGQYTRGDHGCPAVILEAVASHDLWIWHAYFGALGALNDINVLNSSPLFNNIYSGTGPDTSFQVCRNKNRNGYYLVAGIYPEKSVFVKAYTCPDDAKGKKFKRAQERARKDVERAFGALKKWWHILKTPATFTDEAKLTLIMYTCIILHNMIIEDEGHALCLPGGNILDPLRQPIPFGSEEYMRRRAAVNNSEAHHALCGDLVHHIWNVNHVDLNSDPLEDLDNEFSDDDQL